MSIVRLLYFTHTLIVTRLKHKVNNTKLFLLDANLPCCNYTFVRLGQHVIWMSPGLRENGLMENRTAPHDMDTMKGHCNINGYPFASR